MVEQDRRVEMGASAGGSGGQPLNTDEGFAEGFAEGPGREAGRRDRRVLGAVNVDCPRARRDTAGAVRISWLNANRSVNPVRARARRRARR